MFGNKHAFWQAFIVASAIFWIGIMLGVWFESQRTAKLEDFYFNAETNIFDVQLRGDILRMFDFDCETALSENIKFADRIYQEAQELEKYDASNRITDDIVNLHARYDLLRVMLWRNTVVLQEKCSNETNVVVYLYQYKEPSVNTRARQITMSSVLLDLKEKYGDRVILIPIAYDTDVTSLDLFEEAYNLSEFPVVIINQESKFTGLFSVEDLEKELRL
jgi:hypothetical protein